MANRSVRIKKTSHEKGFTLAEVLVVLAFISLLVLLLYKTLFDTQRQAMQTTSSLISLERARIIEDQVRFYLYHAGLGVPADSPVITEAHANSLGLIMNSGFYSYIADSDVYCNSNTTTVAEVQDNSSFSQALEGRDSIQLTILSDDKVPLIGNTDEPPTVSKNGADDSGKLKIQTTATSYWLRKGQYIGETAQLHHFSITNGELHLEITHADGKKVDRIIGAGVDAFDVALYYKPTYFDDSAQPVWCYDNADADPNCRYRSGTFEEPGSFCKQSDPDWDKCVPCAGTINRQLDTNGDGSITVADDANGDGIIDGIGLTEVADLKEAKLLRIWMLVSGEDVVTDKHQETYVVGRKVLKFNDGHKRTLSTIDLDIRNLGI
jgi:prepilin-type N-terminal cleavage/methylation domain-containing protein